MIQRWRMRTRSLTVRQKLLVAAPLLFSFGWLGRLLLPPIAALVLMLLSFAALVIAMMKPESEATALRKSQRRPLVALSLMALGGILVMASAVFMIAQGQTIPWNQWGAILFAPFATCSSVYRMMQSR